MNYMVEMVHIQIIVFFGVIKTVGFYVIFSHYAMFKLKLR